MASYRIQPMTYTPNFNDPRVRKRCEQALSWVEQFVKDQPQWLSTREISRHMSWCGRPLGKYLKDTLLICTDNYFNIHSGQCKKYMKNINGVDKLKQDLGIICVPVVIDKKINEEIATGNFEYKEINHREYHPLQNLPKRVKKPLLSSKGYRHEYDIQCCAQTLLLQHARQLGFTKPTPCLDQYIENRSQVRSDLSDQLGIDTETIKKILTAILNGGSISAWHENMIFAYVSYNRLMIDQLKTNTYIQQYQREVRDMWRHIRGCLDLRYKERFNAKMKSEKYRFLEESVRAVIKRYLRKTKNKSFIEHDGWSSQRAVDIDRLCWEVKQQTGFVIKLDWTIHEYIDSY